MLKVLEFEMPEFEVHTRFLKTTFVDVEQTADFLGSRLMTEKLLVGK